MSTYRQITTHLADYKSCGDGAARILFVMEHGPRLRMALS